MHLHILLKQLSGRGILPEPRLELVTLMIRKLAVKVPGDLEMKFVLGSFAVSAKFNSFTHCSALQKQ
jgi:hypothetical protein